MSNPEVKPVCPQCRSASRVKAAGSFWTCRKCGGFFDGDVSEGGDYFTDPTKRIENEESRQRARRRRWML